MKPGDRVKIRGIAGEATVLESDPTDPPGYVPIEHDAGDAGFVPESWVKVIEP